MPVNLEEKKICEKRGHDPVTLEPLVNSDYQSLLQQAGQASCGWMTCKWCGTQYVIKSRMVNDVIERTDSD